MTEVAKNETMNLLRLLIGGPVMIGLDYMDVITILGDHIPEDHIPSSYKDSEKFPPEEIPADEYLKILHSWTLPEEDFQNFFQHVAFETTEVTEVSEESVQSFVSTVSQHLTENKIVLLVTADLLTEGSTVADAFEKALGSGSDIAFTQTESDDGSKRISVWYRK